GGGIGGPIVKDRTFFWFATEGYRSGTTRNESEVWPTANQRNGDFSHTTIARVPVLLFNPWCRGGVPNSRCLATGTGSIATNGKWSLSGLYIYNKTDEPGSTIMKPDKLFMADQDQWFGPLRRRPHVLVFNNTNVLNNTTVLTLRYGWTTWQDSCDKQAFTPGIQSLGFSPTYVNALGPGGKDTFPSISFPDGDVRSEEHTS